MNRTDLQKLARMRLHEANALLAGGHSSGAYYLGGYCVECALKACIAKNVARFDFPDKELAQKSYTHDLRALLKAAGLLQLLALESEANPEFARNWSIVERWNEASRYRIIVEGDAIKLMQSLDGRSGVLRWIIRYW